MIDSNQKLVLCIKIQYLEECQANLLKKHIKTFGKK